MAEDAPFRFSRRNAADVPLLMSVPHAGQNYPPAMRLTSRLTDAQLRLLEDRHADQLVALSLAAGVPAIVATTARAWIDLNRSEQECDPGFVELPTGMTPVISSKVSGGLGLIPRRLGGRDIWRRRIEADDLAARIADHHRPYHAAVAEHLRRARARFAHVVLLDVHSMPTLSGNGTEQPGQIIVGDSFGRSAHDRFTHCAAEVIAAHGFRPAINHPYAGGHILSRHSRPDGGIHALQIEVDRSLYLDEAGDRTGAGLAPVQRMIAALVAALIAEASGSTMAIAAE